MGLLAVQLHLFGILVAFAMARSLVLASLTIYFDERDRRATERRLVRRPEQLGDEVTESPKT